MLLAGIGFFLYGMSLLEQVLRESSGRWLKVFIHSHTQRMPRAILGGALVTGIIQSSSVVLLMILAFVEAGLMHFSNTVGIVLGAHVVTTLDSWEVATLGFKVNVLDYTLPLLSTGSIGMFILDKRPRHYPFFTFIFAVALIFFGLGLLKDGADLLVHRIDLSQYATYPSIAFVFIGFLLTAIILSSSATVAIRLAALHAQAIRFPAGAAIVIGSEVGTTLKMVLWGMKGSVEKRKVAWADFFYNVFTAVVAFALLRMIIYFISHILGIKNPLISLVFFQTFIIVLALFLFLPFIKPTIYLLNRYIKPGKNQQLSYVSSHLPLQGEMAGEALHNEAENLFYKMLGFIRLNLLISAPKSTSIFGHIRSLADSTPLLSEDYERIKHTEGDLLQHFGKMVDKSLYPEATAPLEQYIHSVRKSVYAAKSMNDIHHNISAFSSSANDVVNKQCDVIREEWIDFENNCLEWMNPALIGSLGSKIDMASSKASVTEEMHKAEVVQWLNENTINEVEASTLLNVYREMLSAKKSLLLGIRYLFIKKFSYL